MKKCLIILISFLLILLPIMLIFTVPYIIVSKSEVINYNDEFIDKYESKSLFKDYTKEVKVKSNVDTSKIGKYIINYYLNFGPFVIKNKKIVNVVDKKDPVINLNGNDEVFVCPNSKYVEEGFEAFDDYDKDITDKVETIENKDSIIYKVKDSSGNYYETKRNIKYVDKESPVIKLKGNSEVYIYKDSKYNESGYTASDNCDGDLTGKVTISNNVDNTKIGTYEIIYTVSDNSNNKSSVKRIVKVIPLPVYNGPNDGKIYLTFDDGPSNLTNEILDILDEENVKATFFVTSNVNNYSSIVKRAFNSGHTIGLHTYSHDYSYIYSSVDNYFNDLYKIDNAVYNIVGSHSKIIRFPGGASNTVSKNYSVGIMSRLSYEVLNKGYSYFDWNVDSNDAGSDIRNSNNIYNNVIKSLSHNKTNVVLMHDSYGHDATVRTLKNIIKYGKANGYSFNAITSNTSLVRHGVNN